MFMQHTRREVKEVKAEKVNRQQLIMFLLYFRLKDADHCGLAWITPIIAHFKQPSGGKRGRGRGNGGGERVKLPLPSLLKLSHSCRHGYSYYIRLPWKQSLNKASRGQEMPWKPRKAAEGGQEAMAVETMSDIR